MSVYSINNTSSYSNANTKNIRNTSGELGKDQFLSLLITQLKYQDPLNPTDNTEYISQLAQFSSLEQMNNMSGGIASMQALSMTGKMVTASYTDSSTGETTSIQGVVDSVKLKSGQAVLLVNGKEVRLENVLQVYEYERSEISNLSPLVGQKCKGYIYNSQNLDVMGVEGMVTGIEKGAYEDYAVVNGVEGQLSSILSSDYTKNQSKLEYLQNHVGKEISLSITDSTTGKTVPVTAELAGFSQEDSMITVTLNKVKVPVDGIYSVNKEV